VIEVSNAQLVVATQAFLNFMTREFYALPRDATECRVPNWFAMNNADRAVVSLAFIGRTAGVFSYARQPRTAPRHE
jgi:hypothetical protein